ncbi:MAG TPA: radical SAM protein [Chloroflexia bacterium]|nr:radical SAM protein [Chloroflexia bacterium]
MIILYNPRITSTKFRLPISVLSLAAVFEGQYPWHLVDGNVDPNAEATIMGLLESDPSIHYLLVTVMPGPQLTSAVPHTRAIKARFPHVTVVWGGYFPTSHTNVVMDDPAIDYVVRNQGELTILELLEALEAGAPVDRIKGLTWRRDGKVMTNPERPLADINSFPLLPYEKIDVPTYLCRTILGDKTIGYHSSQGCPFSCSFCAVTKVYSARWLPEKAERTVSTIRWLQQRYGVNGIEFHDSNFFTAEKRVAAFGEGLKGAGIGWWGEGTIDTMMRYEDRTWDLMRDSGCRMVFLGAESGSATTLKAMNKGALTPETTLEMAKKCKAWGIIPEFSFVLGNPPDPESDIRENIEFIRKIKVLNPASEIILYLYTPTPGGSMYEQAVAGGFRYPETLDEWVGDKWQSFSRRRNPSTPWMRQELLELLNNFETVLSARYPTATDLKIQPWHRQVLQTLGGWRYRFGVYGFPLELRAMFKYISYRRPELEGL